jgi:hypothetical protein
MGRGRGRLGRLARTGALVLSALACTAGPGAAGPYDLETGRALSAWDLPVAPEATGALRALMHEGELSLYPDADDPTRRIPLALRGRGLLGGGSLLPYATIRPAGVLLESDTASAAGLHGLETRYDLARGVDLGAGLSWQLSGGLSLFGEYRFLPLRSAPAGLGDGHIREAEGPELKGGINIRF